MRTITRWLIGLFKRRSLRFRHRYSWITLERKAQCDSYFVCRQSIGKDKRIRGFQATYNSRFEPCLNMYHHANRRLEYILHTDLHVSNQFNNLWKSVLQEEELPIALFYELLRNKNISKNNLVTMYCITSSLFTENLTVVSGATMLLIFQLYKNYVVQWTRHYALILIEEKVLKNLSKPENRHILIDSFLL